MIWVLEEREILLDESDPGDRLYWELKLSLAPMGSSWSQLEVKCFRRASAPVANSVFHLQSPINFLSRYIHWKGGLTLSLSMVR